MAEPKSAALPLGYAPSAGTGSTKNLRCLQGAEYIGAMRVHVKREQASSKRTRVAPPLLRFSTDWKLVRRNTTEIASKRVWQVLPISHGGQIIRINHFGRYGVYG